MLCLSILHSRQAQTGRGQIVMGRRINSGGCKSEILAYSRIFS